VIRLGVVGFGRLVRQYYVPALARLPGTAVAVIADPLAASRTAAQAAFPEATVVATVEELLATKPGAAVVATPPSTHLALWLALTDAGVPVLLEKPFVGRGELAAATAAAAAAPRRAALLALNLNRRLWPAFARVRTAVAAGAIGTVREASYTLHVDVRPWCTVTRHRLLPGEGGTLYDLGSQALDLCTFVAGAAPRAVGARIESGRSPGDRTQLALEYASGLRFHCDLAYADRTAERLVLRGDRGTLQLRDPNMALHRVRWDGTPRFGSGVATDLARLAYRGLRRSRSMARFTIHAALAAFVDAVRAGRPLAPGWADAVRNARGLEAAALAAESGQVTPIVADAATIGAPAVWVGGCA
jgi:predicted dehydrogenase